MKSFTEKSKTSSRSSRMTSFKSATETTLLATKPPKTPDNSFNVAGHTVCREESMTFKASCSGASCCTETFKIELRLSKTRADRDFSTAFVCENRKAMSRKSMQEKTWMTSPHSFKIGTRRGAMHCESSRSLLTGVFLALACLLPVAMMRRTWRIGVPNRIGTNGQWPEQLATSPTGILTISAIALDGVFFPLALSSVRLWLMSM
mmetsp:Transcript_14461/g.29301  ORF Transcript_14461/g.29301 Transcript_14461/m.29301 type:complete len:205 (+) Transcript_14461:399-1013(+)